MLLQINGNSLATRRFLRVKDTHFEFCEYTFFGSTRRLAYKDVLFILLGEDSLLSIQVGSELFRIPTDPKKVRHQEVIEALMARVKAADRVRMARV